MKLVRNSWNAREKSQKIRVTSDCFTYRQWRRTERISTYPWVCRRGVAESCWLRTRVCPSRSWIHSWTSSQSASCVVLLLGIHRVDSSHGRVPALSAYIRHWQLPRSKKLMKQMNPVAVSCRVASRLTNAKRIPILSFDTVLRISHREAGSHRSCVTRAEEARKRVNGGWFELEKRCQLGQRPRSYCLYLFGPLET